MRRYHHIGILTSEAKPGQTHLKHLKVFVVSHEKSEFGVEWMRFEADAAVPDPTAPNTTGYVTGAGALPFAVHQGVFWPRILAAALSLSATGVFMVLLGISHAPAGATTLIVSLGIISKLRQPVIVEVVVFLLVAQALIINCLAG